MSQLLKQLKFRIGPLSFHVDITREPPPLPASGNWVPLVGVYTGDNSNRWDACIDDASLETVMVHCNCDARSEQGRCIACHTPEPDVQGDWYDTFRHKRGEWIAAHSSPKSRSHA